MSEFCKACSYILERNSLIPEAEHLTNAEMETQSIADLARSSFWTRAFHLNMGKLAFKKGLIKEKPVDYRLPLVYDHAGTRYSLNPEEKEEKKALRLNRKEESKTCEVIKEMVVGDYRISTGNGNNKNTPQEKAVNSYEEERGFQ